MGWEEVMFVIIPRGREETVDLVAGGHVDLVSGLVDLVVGSQVGRAYPQLSRKHWTWKIGKSLLVVIFANFD